MIQSQHDPMYCPECLSLLDGSTSFNCHAKPSKGALSVCSYCLSVLVFTGDPFTGKPSLSLRKLEDSEIAELPEITQKELGAAQQLVGQINRKLGR